MMSEEESNNTFAFVYPLWKNLSARRKRQLIISLQLIILNGILDLISVTSILPLLYLLTSDPDKIMNHYFISFIVSLLYIKDPNQLLIYSTILFGIVAVFSGTLRLSNLFYTSRISGAISSDISDMIFSKVIFQPYSYHINVNSSQIITTITTYINNLNSGLTSLLQFITSIILSIFIAIGLLLVNWKLSIFGFLIYLIIYLIIASLGKKRLNDNSKKVANSNILIVKGIQESLGSIRDIIIDSLHNFYIRNHRKLEYSMRKLIAQNIFLTFFPRYALESLTLIMISIVIVFKANIFPNADTIIPTLGALSIGIQKLLPSFQSIYISWASINSQKSSINKLMKFIKLQKKNINKKNNDNLEIYNAKKNNLQFRSLELENVSYKYSSQEKNIFSNLNLTIKRGEIIGIIGKTGDGKSTLLDLIMGLTKPTSGEIKWNGKDLQSNNFYINYWRKQISHVPQNIFMSDRTIAENIALGFSKDEIDYKRLYKSAERAKIDDFIKTLKFKYNSVIGESGLKISGGQRQRIGIARALYSNPKVLILDEATSALDEDTERSVMESLTKIGNDITIIIVAHRLKTIKYCNRLIKLEKGEIFFDGDPYKLSN